MQIPAEERLNARQLAERIGPRVAGRPTAAKTVWLWMQEGIRGVRLRHVQEVGIKLTTWAWYEEFREAVAEARDEQRVERLAAVAAARGPDARRQAKAEKKWKAGAAKG